MMQNKKAFTLIEMLISITILSIMMLFLYKSYSSLNLSNKFYEKKTTKIKKHQLKKKILFLDFSLKLGKKVTIINQDAKHDIVFFQSSNSIHERYNPYIAYIAKKSKLYRLESLKKFKEYPLSTDAIFDVDYFGEINSFRVYLSNNNNNNKKKDLNNTKNVNFLISVDFKKEDNLIYKIVPLN